MSSELKINRLFVPDSLKNNPNKNLKSIDFITIHSTDNYSATASAKNHADYQYGGSGGRLASWHYTVDADEIWQSFPDERMCWHAGDGGSGKGNSTSIAIELCVNNQSRYPEVCERAAQLAAKLLAEHNLPLEAVVQHFRWSKKNCPSELRSGAWGVTWAGFLNSVEKYSLAREDQPDKTGEESPVISIISAPTAAQSQAEAWAKSKKATDTFVSLAALYWRLSLSRGGVNPAVAFCQAAVETGYGKFGGVIDESYHNPCGMKTKTGGDNNDKNAHQRFTSWEEGVTAHLDHLALYAGAEGYPRADTPDPRHFPSLKGTSATVEGLSGVWATSKTYAENIETLLKGVIASAPSSPEAPENDTPSDWAKEAWTWAVSKGITDGSNPKNYATREQVIQLLYNALGDL